MDKYDEILNIFQNTGFDSINTKQWCFRYLNNLFKNDYQSSEVQNLVILILNLFFVDVPDHYHIKGKSRKELDDESSTQFLRILNSELKG